MTQRIGHHHWRAIAVVRMAAVIIVAALIGDGSSSDIKADFRTVLASSGVAIFSARLVDVPPPVANRKFDGALPAHVRANARYWLLLGDEFERKEGISLARMTLLTGDGSQLLTALHTYQRHARDRRRWCNIAFAKAVSGDFEAAASMLEMAAVFCDFRARREAAPMQ